MGGVDIYSKIMLDEYSKANWAEVQMNVVKN